MLHLRGKRNIFLLKDTRGMIIAVGSQQVIGKRVIPPEPFPANRGIEPFEKNVYPQGQR